MRTAAQRIIILERVSASTLQYSCEQHMFARHRIPNDRTAEVLHQMMDDIKAAKETQGDAVPLLSKTLAEQSPPPLRPLDHIDWEDASIWEKTISREGALLLSGVPRSGKTDAARCLASKFETQGYQIRDGSDVDEAERFLRDSGVGARLFLLDDPLGGTYSNPEAGRVLEKLHKLLPQLPQNRKIVISQNQNQLLATARKTELSRCSVAGKKWIDLSNPSADFLVRVWIRIADTLGVPSDMREMLADALSSGKEQMEIGCLQHLALSFDQLPSSPTLEQSVRLARQNAADLGQSLSNMNNEMTELLAALAIGSSPNHPVALDEVAFCIDSGSPKLPTKKSTEMNVISFGGEPSDTRLPAYDVPPTLPNGTRTNLDYLERHRFITEDAHGAFVFAHPFYRAAAEAMFQGATSVVGSLAIRTVERGLFCLSPRTSGATARNLDWLYDALLDRRADQEQIVQKAIDAVKFSLFPATRDLCFQFLARKLKILTPEKQEEIPKLVGCILTDLSDMEWRDGNAWLPSTGFISGRDAMEWMFQTVEYSEVEDDLNGIEQATLEFLSPQRAALILNYLKDNSEGMSSRVLVRMLSYDEAVIRAEAARIWLTRPRSDDAELLRRIIEDGHPNVVLNVAKGIVEGWAECSDSRRSAVLEGLSKASLDPAAAAVLLQWLVLFNRVEEVGEHPPWLLFGKIMPNVLRALPPMTSFNDGRFYAVMKDATRELNVNAVVDICLEWAAWLEVEISHGLPSEYSLTVMDVLITATRHQHELRSQLFNKLLSFSSTGALMIFIRDLVDAWDLLSDTECDVVVELLKQDRIDRWWLQAVAITRSEVPKEIQAHLLGHADFLNNPPEMLIDKLEPNLLEDAISVYCGQPQPLWWLATHHSGAQIWEGVLEIIELRPDHHMFETALDEAFMKQDGDQITKIIRNGGKPHSEKLFSLMLGHFVTSNPVWYPEAWLALLELAPDDDTKSSWFDNMEKMAPAVLDDLSELSRWLSSDDDTSEMLRRLETDYIVLALLHQIQEALKNKPDTGTEPYIEKLKDIFHSKNPPRLHGTYLRSLRTLKNLSLDHDAFETELEKMRLSTLEVKKNIEDTMRQVPSQLLGWVRS
jgi:hypothetical protein